MGKALVMCAGEQERWNSPAPKQIVPVLNGEPLIKRTVRQVRKRMSNYPHIVSHQKCLRAYSANFIVPTTRRYICESLLSVNLIWGNDWTVVLLGDVFYTDELMDSIYYKREKYDYHFYGTPGEIYALSFTNNALVEAALFEVIADADAGNSRGKLWELYYRLSNLPMKDAVDGRLLEYRGGEDAQHFTHVHDSSKDFDTLEGYAEWTKQNLLN